jgi:hypothetical protein
VTTVVIDTAQRAEFIAKLRNDANWRVVYEDPQAVIFTRREIGRPPSR